MRVPSVAETSGMAVGHGARPRAVPSPATMVRIPSSWVTITGVRSATVIGSCPAGRSPRSHGGSTAPAPVELQLPPRRGAARSSRDRSPRARSTWRRPEPFLTVDLHRSCTEQRCVTKGDATGHDDYHAHPRDRPRSQLATASFIDVQDQWSGPWRPVGLRLSRRRLQRGFVRGDRVIDGHGQSLRSAAPLARAGSRSATRPRAR